MTTGAATGDAVRSSTLFELRGQIEDLTLEERTLVIEQALVLIEQLYVHLPLKRAMHAVDPVQRLKLLKGRAAGFSEREFHDELIAIFTELRDLHTNYILPVPYQSKTAFLPFRVQELFEGNQRRYLVVEVNAALLGDPALRPGATVTHWNGVPMDRAVELNGARQAGSNRDARHARGLNTLTVRPMALSAPPDEEWVLVGYSGEDGQAREARVEWRVFEPPPAPTAVDPDAADEPLARTLGIDAQTEAVRRARKALFAPEAMEVERQVSELTRMAGLAPGARPPGMSDLSILPDVLQFRTVSTPHGDFGYLRIRTFSPGGGIPGVDAFVAEVVRIVELLPQQGLILDVRGNGGGVIMAGERLLQLFTPRRIEPERLHFLNSPLTLELCQQVPDFALWTSSIAEAVETATTFSDGFPVLPGEPEDCNAVGQRYHGPVVLLIDPLCYSTTDITIAGWQDHAIGPILGTGGNTGAGGANVWTHELLESFLAGPGSPIRPLPKGASFRVAVRRTTRVGERSGDPVEDLGVIPDAVHRLTRYDLLHDNQDLISRAGEMLAAMPVRALTAEATPAPAGGIGVKVTTRGLSRLDAYVDGRPRHTLDVADGTFAFEIATQAVSPSVLELRGFDAGGLAAARRLPL